MYIRLFSLIASCFVIVSLLSCQGSQSLLKKGDRIAIVGNSLAERFQYDGWLETYLYSACPAHDFTVRNLGYSGDQVHYRPRSHQGFGDADSHLSRIGANVIFSFFGYNESFEDKPEEFKRQLRAWIDHTRAQKYDALRKPKLVLFSPIAHENLRSPNFPDGTENNRRLASYTEAMKTIAKEKGVRFVDLFAASQKMYETASAPLTINGVHLNEKGNQEIGRYITQALLGTTKKPSETAMKTLRSAIMDKNEHWHKRYRTTSGNDVWGTRSIQDGNKATLNRELIMIDTLTVNRDRRIWALAKGSDLSLDDRNLPEPIIVGTHITRDVEYLDPKEAIQKMTVPDDLKVNLFASEKEFPELANPVAMQVDAKGRIWVAAWGDYPKWEPGKASNDRLVYLTDDDGDGVADKLTTFAYVANPTGFEFWNNGVIVASAPDILFLKDTDGDGVADYKERLFTGIGSDDTHHSANNLIYGPDGWIYYQRGIFILENVETPYRRSEESGTSGLYRFNPRTADFSFVVENSPNPHGISFDKWGNQFLTDGTSGQAFHVYADRKVTATSDVTTWAKRKLFAQTVRPICANAVLASSHFPESYRNNFLLLNVIGYQGIKRYQLDYKREGIVEGKELENFLFTGTDPTFTPNTEATPRQVDERYTGDPNLRPSDAVTGPDGALYFSDWQNAVITHSPYNLRDASRDQTHGRIYRVTAKNRPLLAAAKIDGQPIEALLELFKSTEDETRHRVRVELSGRPTEEVIAQAAEWVKQFDINRKEDCLPMLEILWLYQQHNRKNHALLRTLLKAPEEQARLAAQKIAWAWSERNAHFVGPAHNKVSGMQFRTHYEKFWVHPDSLESTSHAGHAHVHAGSTPQTSQTVVLDLTKEKVAKVTIETVMLKFSVQQFNVKPSQKVELTLDNTDLMQHNLLVVAPGAADEVAQQAIELGDKGPAKAYIPANKKVLHATRLLEAKQKETLTFDAPKTPGDYQYVCTFPGHGPVMRGIMRVLP
jgi:azurin/glucose/arabinose dehydrogenase